MAVVRVEPAALKFDWEFLKGDTFDLVVPVLDATNFPVDVDGWSVRSQARRSDDDPLLYEWSTALGNAEVSGTDAVLHVDGLITRAWTWRDALFSVEVVEPDDTPHVIAYGALHALSNPTQ